MPVEPGLVTAPSTAVVRKIRLPHTTGDEWPRPGMGVFHSTFSDALQVSGRPVSAETPWPFGPRNCGQV